MHRARKHRLYAVLVLLLTVGAACVFALYALRNNINLYYTPSQITSAIKSADRTYRIGGWVVARSIHHLPHTATVTFRITDKTAEIPVQYTGVLPDLFRENQGIVVQGKFAPDGIFVANEVLAKHDEKYEPPV